MSPRKAPIKIDVIEEEDVSTKRKAASATKKVAKKKATATAKKTPLKKTTIPKANVARKKVQAVDDTQETGVLPSKISFEEKLRRELVDTFTSAKRKTIINEIEDKEEDDDGDEDDEFNQQLDEIELSPTEKNKEPVLDPSEDEEIQEIVKLKDRNSRSVSVYKRIAYFFIFLVFALLVSSAYFLLTKVTIVLVPDQERHSGNLIFDVEDNDSEGTANRTKVMGVVKTVEIEQEKEYDASGSEVIGQEAVGKVKIINDYTKSQMLVATTRLLSASGELFRLKNTVNVPAGGEVDAEIYADEASPEMAIGPTTFNIPGLWAGLQDKIYAKSSESVVYQKKIKKHVTQEDIDNALRDMRTQLLNKAKQEINKAYSEYDEIIYNLDEETIDYELDSEVGDEVDEINVDMSAEVIVVAFQSKEAGELAKEKFEASIDDDKEILSFDNENIIYSLNNYSSTEGIATINAAFEGKVSLRDNSQVLDKERIIGLNKKQLEIFLAEDDSMKDISGFDIKFYPSFLPEFLKKVPRLPERIEIVIKK